MSALSGAVSERWRLRFFRALNRNVLDLSTIAQTGLGARR